MEITKLICLGDSITWGFPFGPEHSWVNLASRTLGINMVNRGINGNTAEDLVNRFNTDVLSQYPSHVLIMVGTNDANMNLPLDKYSESISVMFETARENKISTIIALPVPSMDRWLEYTLEKYRYWLCNFIAARNIPMVDFAAVMQLPDGTVNPECFVDEVHPSKTGYQWMAAGLITFLKSGHV